MYSGIRLEDSARSSTNRNSLLEEPLPYKLTILLILIFA